MYIYTYVHCIHTHTHTHTHIHVHVYIYTLDYYSAIKGNAFESVLKKWVNLEPITQNEVNDREKQV